MSKTILAIDPGNKESGWCVIDSETRKPLRFGKNDNDTLRFAMLNSIYDHVAIEMVASYGMPVGAEVFDTCVWIGRLWERCENAGKRELVYRKDVKLHHCGVTSAKDSNIRLALVDRFARGEKNYGKGTKKDPGFFYGFSADMWQAFALAVYVADREAAQARQDKMKARIGEALR